MKRVKTLDCLPPELLTEILKRLEVVILLRVKLVCKLWNSIIRDHRFVQLNSRFLNETSSDHVGKYLLSREGIKDAVLNVRCSKTFCVDETLDPINHLGNTLVCRIVAYADGVLLINISLRYINDGNNLILVWNPTIRKIVEVPPHKSFKKHRNVCFGFGFDQVTKDYKVVAVNVNYCKTKSMVYSLRSRTWSNAKNDQKVSPSLYLDKFSRAVTFEGGIYWVADVKKKEKKSSHLLRFDLSSEGFTCAPLPEFNYQREGGLNLPRRSVSILDKSLAVIDNYGSVGRYVCIWIYGSIEKSWIKFYTLDIWNNENLEDKYMPSSGFLCLKRNGEIYFRRRTGVFVGNSKPTQRQKRLRNACKGHIDIIDVYKESLVLQGEQDISQETKSILDLIHKLPHNSYAYHAYKCKRQNQRLEN